MLTAERENQLREDARKRLDEADQRLRQLAGRPLRPKDHESFLLAQSLLEQARKALAGQEYERAVTLATKARTLADDLTGALR
jgi:hypothetical protein